jgi:hypothetical protein
VNLMSKSLRRLVGKASGYRRGKRRKRSIALLGKCELFDRAWYIQSYPDVRDSGVDPIRHYFDSGWREGRDPGPDFCTMAYLKANSDVAASGINPLLHYVEHGKFEGRGAPHQGAPFRASFSPDERFGPAAPCARFERPDRPTPRWTRAGRIRTEEHGAVTIGGLTVATFSDDQDRQSFDRALHQMAWFSGRTPTAPATMQISTGITLGLRDAWGAGAGALRTRWSNVERPLVVRAIQHVEEQPVLVGEGCVADGLDSVDVVPRNPFFPLLFLFTTTAGEFVGWWQLTFPALCRGAVHYSELIALTGQDAPLDLPSVDRAFTERLFTVRTGRAERMVGELSVALVRADGTFPLFQGNYREWLSQVMHLPATAASEVTSAGEEYLAAAVKLDAGPAANGRAVLKLSGDMVPSLSALVMSSRGSGKEDLAGSTIIESADRNLANLVRVPSGMSATDFGDDVSSLPTISSQSPQPGSFGDAPLLAIRLARRRPLDEAELLVPNASRLPAEPPAISWIICADQWNEAQLAQSLEALKQQKTKVSSVIFRGYVWKTIIDHAKRLFESRVDFAADAGHVGELIETPFAGYLGPGIVLHDRRTASLLAHALEASDAVTATALIVTAEKRGKGSLVVADRDNALAAAAFLPGATVPLAGPQTEFWITRAQNLRRGAEPKGKHVCVTKVAISRLTEAKPGVPFAFLPACGEPSVRSEALIG